ncbi:uncharacterized protein PHALS_01854 [Plasmopara halstedii]|uniref:Uncharacterized protein n=1 Tax=Plasmopara halstedii TaxID=4781 RepID=A0A0P1ATK5_PLAHL|nr:uncharacterized protein PHALS_01854 [Plasmopara halstedii]CEG45567.1 hypothetical protein PHALS_01854 [Plasmopara halstedii]|eukprot:XP_024581936.1 hypothetical protein PHALS_01854 [Plasmopara halstedii]
MGEGVSCERIPQLRAEKAYQFFMAESNTRSSLSLLQVTAIILRRYIPCLGIAAKASIKRHPI